MQTFTKVYGVNIERETHIYSACMEMAKWKDEQHAQEKQQWIDEACVASHIANELKNENLK